MNEYIDHTILKPDTTKDDVVKLCEEAERYKFASVCVASSWVKLAKENLSTVPIATVVGFPHGNSEIQTKQLEAWNATIDGAKEIDAVINIGALKSGDWDLVEREIQELRKEIDADRKKSILIKYIVEVGYLTDEELFRVADLLIKHKIDFIKTCTGYGPRGVQLEDIVKIKNHVGDAIKIKASGGIKTADFAKQLINAGADRIGCSASVSIVEGK